MRRLSFPLTAVLALGCVVGATSRVGQAEPDEALKRRIERGCDRGVTFLKRNQGRDGMWYHRGPASEGGLPLQQNVGATAMCGIAMLESGVDTDDKSIQRAAAAIRKHAKDLTYTYSISAAIIFMERIGDTSTVTMLAQKLLRGQGRGGAWSYYASAGGTEDHSNTQFATLALWIARRHGANVARSLQAAEARYRSCQQDDGGWSYQIGGLGDLGRPTPSMTCAGLLGLAFGFGTKYKPETELRGANPNAEGGDGPPGKPQRVRPDLKSDPQVIKAKNWLSLWIPQIGAATEHVVYFLWTLERVCMIYGYSQFNGIDWYNWGANLLLSMQNQDGSWSRDALSGPFVETSWALLFLRKSNLAADLEIGESVLTGGSMKDVGRRPGGAAPVRQAPKQEKAQYGREGKPGEAEALKEELRNTVVDERVEEILDLLEKTKGNDYTMALVEGIGKVRPAIQERLRLTLQKRISRMSANTLKAYLGVEEKELKIAALAVIASKSLRPLIPDVIPLLAERDQAISGAAYEALKKMSGKDFGRDQGQWLKWWDAGGK